MKFRVCAGLLLLIVCQLTAQEAGRPGGTGAKPRNMNIGRLYGKLQDSLSGKPMEYGVIQVFGNVFDTLTKKFRYTVITGDLTKANGDFSLENLPVMGEITIKITALGYQAKEIKFAFKLDFQQMGKQRSQSGEGQGSSALNALDKDLGNIKLQSDAKLLKGVTIEGTTPDVEIRLDKKIYNIEKNLTIAGGTAEDALKTIPAITVDLDGNVSMRNASPQIFVDGRPTTLTIDQIPADAIETIEVISNPSAKYDASGGMAGIINIVLKKNRKTGYNGSLRAGVDSRGKINAGADINIREGKWNVFASAGLHQRKSISNNTTTRSNLIGSPLTHLNQSDESVSTGFFSYGRLGCDYFMNNRNTFTLSGNLGFGQFSTIDPLNTNVDTLHPNYIASSMNTRNTVSDRNFKNMGAALLYKHLFPKEGRELTADFNFNSNGGTSTGNYQTRFFNSSGQEYRIPVSQRQEGGSDNQFFTLQSDFVTPLKTTMKLETGIRASIKDYTSTSSSFLMNPSTNEFVQLKAFGVNYMFSDQVYAAYGTFSQEFKKFSYQAGLRAESSVYDGKFMDSTTTYSYTYPLIPFPSLFATYHLTDKSDIQLSYSRRINRPNFFQLIPATDFSDSLNIKRGNPALKPEFTNSIELSYLKTFSSANTFMFGGYYKYSTDLITNYQILENNSLLHKRIIVTTYENALTSNSYGAELTDKTTLSRMLEFTASANFYYSTIDASNITPGLVNTRFNWFARLATTVRLPRNMSFQFSGEYTAKSNLPLNSSGGGRWGGGGGGGGYAMFGGGAPGATAQGYSLPVYYIDAGFRIDFLKEKKANLTISVSDMLKTRIVQTHSESSYFNQDVSRTRDQLFFRVNLSWRFGKFDVSLFRRKNTKSGADGMDMQGG